MSLIRFKLDVGTSVEYSVGVESITGTVTGLYQYKNEPTQALVEYISKDGTVCTLWRNEEDLDVIG